jgi:hypothetical protein
MSKAPWASINQVSGPSPYVRELVEAINATLDQVKGKVDQKKYVRNLLDKAANLVLAKFTAALVKSRPLREIGAEQVSPRGWLGVSGITGSSFFSS